MTYLGLSNGQTVNVGEESAGGNSRDESVLHADLQTNSISRVETVLRRGVVVGFAKLDDEIL
jgi:hypothetical protein